MAYRSCTSSVHRDEFEQKRTKEWLQAKSFYIFVLLCIILVFLSEITPLVPSMTSAKLHDTSYVLQTTGSELVFSIVIIIAKFILEVSGVTPGMNLAQ